MGRLKLGTQDLGIINILSGQARLNAPTIEKNGATITLSNPTTNGNFATGFEIFLNGISIVKQIISVTTCDLSDFLTTIGTNVIIAQCYGNGIQSSMDSNSVVYDVYGVDFVGGNCVSEGGTSAVGGIAYTAFLMADSGYYLPRKITVSVGGTVLASGYTWADGILTISGATINGAVYINCIATDTPPATIWGVSGLGNSDPTLTRTFGNIGNNYTINSSSGTITTDFDNIFNFETVVQDGNTMIKIPKMYKRFDTITNDQITAFSLSMEGGSDFIVYPCFVDNNGNELDYILVSKGKATGTSTKATCVSGSNPLVSITRANARTAARANGTGWEQYFYSVHQLIRDLFCVVFATTNSQSIFLGRTKGFSGAATVGNTWNIPTPCGWDLTTMQNRFFGIEDIFGNVSDWCDGVTFSSSSCYTTNNTTLFSDTTSEMTLSGSRATSSSYTSALNYNVSYPFFNYSKSNSGSESTYYCDYNSYNSLGVVLPLGGCWKDGAVAGLWFANGDWGASDSSSSIGVRLVYRPL